MRHQLLSGLSWKLILSESIFMCDFYLWRHFIFSPLLKETQRWPGLPWGMWSWQALLWSAGTRESYWRTYASSPGAPIHNMWICTLCTHTHSHTQRPARVRTLSHRNSLHPPIPQSCYCVLHLCSVQLKTDRIRASLHPPVLSLPPGFPLIHHSSLPS